jgi:hypothetical protein
MLKHNIAASEIIPVTVSSVEETYNFISDLHPKQRRLYKNWEISLGIGVGAYFDCKVLLIDKRNLIFIGLGPDVAAAQLAFKNTLIAIWGLAQKRTKEYTQGMKDRGYNVAWLTGSYHPNAFRTAYVVGVVAGFRQRLAQEKRQDTPQETGLILRKDLAIKEYFVEKYPHTNKRNFDTTTRNSGARAQGYQDGKNLSMVKGALETA